MRPRVHGEGWWASATVAGAGVGFLGACCLVATGCCADHTGSGIGSGPPRLVVPAEGLDLGQGTPGEELKGSLVLKNDGGAALHIAKVDPGCSCAWYRLARQDIRPGEQAELQLAARIRTEGEHISFHVQIFSNDPASPVAGCLVKAKAAPPPVRTDPEVLDFGEVAVGTSPVRYLRALKPDGHPWLAAEALDAKAGRGQIRVRKTPAPVGDEGAGLVVEVRPDPDLPLGPFSDTLTLHPGGGLRTAEVMVRGSVVPPLVASPTTLYFGDVKVEGGPLKRSLLLRRTDGKPLRPLLKSTAPAGLGVDEAGATGSPPADARRRLVVTLDPTALTHDIPHGKLLLWLQDEPEPVTVGILIFLSRHRGQAMP